MTSQVTIEERVVEEVIPLQEREEQAPTTSRFPIGKIAVIAAAGAIASAAATVAATIVLNRRFAAHRPRRAFPFAMRFTLPFALPFGRKPVRRTPVARIAHQCQHQAERMSKMMAHR